MWQALSEAKTKLWQCAIGFSSSWQIFRKKVIILQDYYMIEFHQKCHYNARLPHDWRNRPRTDKLWSDLWSSVNKKTCLRRFRCFRFCLEASSLWDHERCWKAFGTSSKKQQFRTSNVEFDTGGSWSIRMWIIQILGSKSYRKWSPICAMLICSLIWIIRKKITHFSFRFNQDPPAMLSCLWVFFPVRFKDGLQGETVCGLLQLLLDLQRTDQE